MVVAVQRPTLRDAVEQGDLRLLRELIAAGADVNEADAEGFTPLHVVAGNLRLAPQLAGQIASDLVDAGADPDARSRDLCLAPEDMSPRHPELTLYKLTLLPKRVGVTVLDQDFWTEGHGFVVARIAEHLLRAGSVARFELSSRDGPGTVGNALSGLADLERYMDTGAMFQRVVVNLSWSVDQESQALADALNRVVDRGAIVITAAGNDATDVLPFPASHPAAWAVGTTDAESNHGPSVRYVVESPVEVLSAYFTDALSRLMVDGLTTPDGRVAHESFRLAIDRVAAAHKQGNLTATELLEIERTLEGSPSARRAFRDFRTMLTARGTSLAAAHLSGAIGEMLRRDPTLTTGEIESFLQRATHDGVLRPGDAVDMVRCVQSATSTGLFYGRSASAEAQ